MVNYAFRAHLYLRKKKQKGHSFFLNEIDGVKLAVESCKRLILQLSSLYVNTSSKIHISQVVAPPGCKDHLSFFRSLSRTQMFYDGS